MKGFLGFYAFGVVSLKRYKESGSFSLYSKMFYHLAALETRSAARMSHICSGGMESGL